MTVFKNADELFAFLKEYYVRNGGKVDISTFNMYLGITEQKDWGSIYRNSVREFINVIKKDDLRLILGVPAYHECKNNCEHCNEKYTNTLKRHRMTIEKLNLNTRIHHDLHLKMYRVGDLYVSGGINLTASNSLDASFVILDEVQKEFLNELFETTWIQLESTNILLPA